MIIRSDFRSAPTPVPQDLKDAIRRAGGTNLYAEPIYRLARAEERYTKASGIWSIWDESLSVTERGGVDIDSVVRMVQNGQSAEAIDEYVAGCLARHPEKTIAGMMDVPVYGDLEGWVLEKWRPAPCSRTEWEAISICGGPAAGIYPECGEYVLCAGPTPYLPTSDQLQEAIRLDFRTIEQKSPSAAARTLQRLHRIQAREQAKKKQISEHLITVQKDGPMSLRNRISLGAGRVRQEWADKAGLKGHFGN